MSRQVGSKEIAIYLEVHQKRGGSEENTQLGMTKGLLLRVSPDRRLLAPAKWRPYCYEVLQQTV